jgi:translation initiation factor IF-2
MPAEAAPKAKKAPAKKAAAKITVKVEDLPPELQQMIEDATPIAKPAMPPRAANNPFSIKSKHSANWYFNAKTTTGWK